MHFFVKLALAAPVSFLSAARAVQLALASVSHFFMKLVFAAPASLLSLTVPEHEEASARARAGTAADETRLRVTARINVFMLANPSIILRHFGTEGGAFTTR
jgi:hypothetical protein